MGFGGGVPNGLKVHPDGKHMIYPLGSTIIVREMDNPFGISFLRGHENGPVSCIAISRSGRYIASGQSTHMGFKVSYSRF